MQSNWEREVLSWGEIDDQGRPKKPLFRHQGVCQCPDFVVCRHRLNFIKRFFRGVLRFEVFEAAEGIMTNLAPANNLQVFQETRSPDFIKGYDTAVKCARRESQKYF